MTWVALVAWVLTALGGATLGAQWLGRGGPRDRRGIGTARLSSHAGLAVGGLALWLVYALTDDALYAWLAIAALALVIALGLWMFLIWLRGHSPEGERTQLPAETAFPVPLVLGHGLLGATTLVLALVAAVL